MKHLASLLVILMSVLAACNHGGGEDTATPRRHAYPRVQTYDSVYTAVDSFPVHFEVNAQAGKRVAARPDGSMWYILPMEPSCM